MTHSTSQLDPALAVGLMYHDAHVNGDSDASGFKGAGPDWYKLDAVDMDAQFAALASRYHTRVATTADASRDVPLFITFDDGGVSAATLIADLLEKHSLCGFFFITTDRIGTSGFVSEAQLRELRERGHVIGSHSCSHPDAMWQLNRTQLNREWTESRQRLEDILGEDVRIASVPGGEYSGMIADTAAEAGYTRLFNSEPVKRTVRRGDCLVLGRYFISRKNTLEDVVQMADESSNGYQLKCYASATTRKVMKKTMGSGYYRLRRFVIERIS